MKTDASFRLASVTKPMTAVAIVQLADAGKIDLDAEIQTYVPYFPRKKYPVTVRQLLGHIGGIPHYKNFETELHIKELGIYEIPVQLGAETVATAKVWVVEEI